MIGQVGVEKLRKYGQLVSDVSTSINGISPFLEFTVHQVRVLKSLLEFYVSIIMICESLSSDNLKYNFFYFEGLSYSSNFGTVARWRN